MKSNESKDNFLSQADEYIIEYKKIDVQLKRTHQPNPNNPYPKGLMRINIKEAPKTPPQRQLFVPEKLRQKLTSTEDEVIPPRNEKTPSPSDCQLLKKSDDGRKDYLKQRRLLSPDKRFHFPQTTSQTVGWCIKQRAAGSREEHFGRSKIVRDTFFAQNGVDI